MGSTLLSSNRRTGFLLCGLILLLGRSVAAHPDLDRAKNQYIAQNYAKVIQLVRPLVEPRSVLATEDEEAKAYELLGLSYWWLKKYKASEAAFLVLLSMRPRHRLNPAIHPAKLIRFFAWMRKRIKRKPLKIHRRQLKELRLCRTNLGKAHRRLARTRKRCVHKVVIKRHLWPNFLPFGIGQFNNGDRIKGWIFFSTELALLLANAGSYIMAETSWVRNGPNGTVRNDATSIKRARTVQILEITTGSLLASLAIAGIIEALVMYKGTTIRTEPVEWNTGRLHLSMEPHNPLKLTWDFR